MRYCIPTYYLTNYVLTKHKNAIIVIKLCKITWSRDHVGSIGFYHGRRFYLTQGSWIFHVFSRFEKCFTGLTTNLLMIYISIKWDNFEQRHVFKHVMRQRFEVLEKLKKCFNLIMLMVKYSAIIHFIIYSCAFPPVTCQNVFCEKVVPRSIHTVSPTGQNSLFWGSACKNVWQFFQARTYNLYLHR